jgi:hypothetical protein
MEECGAMLLHLHNRAAERILGGAAGDILANKPAPEREVTRIIEVPRRGLFPRLFGG